MLSIIIPIYNEESIIKNNVNATLKELYKNKIKFELILVENGSKDNTYKILKNIKDKNIKIVKLKKNQTFGGGVIEGLLASKGDHVCITCADNQVIPSELVRLYKITKNNNINFCKGDRGLKYKKLFRRFASRMYKLIVKSLFMLKEKDINGYPIIMKRSVYEEINPKLRNWIIQVELLYKAKKKNYKVVEIPVSHSDRVTTKSHVDFKVVWSMFIDLLKFRLKTFKND